MGLSHVRLSQDIFDAMLEIVCYLALSIWLPLHVDAHELVLLVILTDHRHWIKTSRINSIV